MEELQKLKQLYEQGFMTKEEYDSRRLKIIDAMTNTNAEKKSAAPEPPKRPDVYAGRHFAETNPDALQHGTYLVVTPPMAHNRHLHTGAAPDNPFSYITAPVPIDPKRAYNQEHEVKKQGTEQLVFASQAPGSADRQEIVAKMEEDKKKLSWEELLDRGADVNQRDHDTEATPIIVAAARNQKHAVYYMVERGADVNAQNVRGETALHEAVKNKFNEMALWLVKHGADIHLENYRGYSPYDLALPWLQKELKDERDHYLREQKKKLAQAKQQLMPPVPVANAAPGAAPPQISAEEQALQLIMSTKQRPVNKDGATPQFDELYGTPIERRVVRAENGAPIQEVLAQYAQPAPAPASPKAPTHQEVMKIYLKNGGYKSVVVTSEHTAKDLAESVADKLNMAKFANYFDVIESVKGQGPSGNETELHCKFIVVPKRGTPENITMMYRDAIYGGK